MSKTIKDKPLGLHTPSRVTSVAAPVEKQFYHHFFVEGMVDVYVKVSHEHLHNALESNVAVITEIPKDAHVVETTYEASTIMMKKLIERMHAYEETQSEIERMHAYEETQGEMKDLSK